MTIKEIAKMAGVSSAAISRYLNGGYVSEEKREQIRKVIEETGYQPSIQARMLRTKRACLVGVVVPKINSETISRVTAGIGQVLSARGYQMLLASTDNTASKEIDYLKLFERYPVDGIILIGTMITAEHRRFLKESKVPVVVIGQYTKYANCIYHDDYGAGKALGRIVGAAAKGKVAYIGVTRDDKAAGAAREDGFRAGLKSMGVELDSEYVRTVDFTTAAGCEAAQDLIEEKDDIDIISCATDTIAAGAVEAIMGYQNRTGKVEAQRSEDGFGSRLGKRGIRVSGFGDNELLKAVTGGFPSVHYGYKTSGIRGAELLLDVVERGEKIPVEIKLGYRLVNCEAEEDSLE